MTQIWLPVFPKGINEINDILAYVNEGDNIVYYSGMMPVFTHEKDDIPSFRLILSQFYVNGNATQAELVRAFGIPPVTLKRAVKLYREKGIKAFYEPQKRGGARVLTPNIVSEIESLLDDNKEIAEVAKQLGIKKDTITKGIQQGRIKKNSSKKTILNH